MLLEWLDPCLAEPIPGGLLGDVSCHADEVAVSKVAALVKIRVHLCGQSDVAGGAGTGPRLSRTLRGRASLFGEWIAIREKLPASPLRLGFSS